MTESIPASLRWRLSMMWALEWGITGSVMTYLPLYLSNSGFDEHQLGMLMAVSAVGLWVAPFVVGQVCDRWMATDKYMALAHLIGGLTLLFVPIVIESFDPRQGDRFMLVLTLLGLFACAYIPTIPLASSLTFRHLSDPDAQFGKVRVWGTVGWVVSGLTLSCWLGSRSIYEFLTRQFLERGWDTALLVSFREKCLWLDEPSSADSFRIAAVLSFILSSFCIFLPSTPPSPSNGDGIAPLQVLKLFKNSSFAMLIGVSFLLAAVVPFYSLAVPQLLTASGISDDWVPAVMTIGQISEFPSLYLLHRCNRRWGLKGTFAAGILAWMVRYTLFASTRTIGWMLLGISLHGVCHVFIVIAIQIYIDRRCPEGLRASMQNLFAFVTVGIAMPVGFVFCGWLAKLCGLTNGAAGDYATFFATPAIVLAIVIPIYWRYFRVEETKWSEE